MYTLKDYENAKETVERWDNAFYNDRSNNPNSYRSERQNSRSKLKEIERVLKKEGLLEKSINDKLDELYPNSRSKKRVVYEGNRYQIEYYPLVKSRSGKTVREWSHTWNLLE